MPTADVSIDRIAVIADSGGEIAGLIGIETFGTTGLLRSLVVDSRRRNSGLGRMLVDALENHARSRGIDDLWLLTIDAAGFFEQQGYIRKARIDAPQRVRETAEFSHLCPDDAVLMRKSLGD